MKCKLQYSLCYFRLLTCQMSSQYVSIIMRYWMDWGRRLSVSDKIMTDTMPCVYVSIATDKHPGHVATCLLSNYQATKVNVVFIFIITTIHSKARLFLYNAHCREVKRIFKCNFYTCRESCLKSLSFLGSIDTSIFTTHQLCGFFWEN